MQCIQIPLQGNFKLQRHLIKGINMDNQLTLVIATRNPGKTKEIRHLLKDFPITIKNLDDFGPIPEVIEDGDTFDDNAYKKSSFTARILGFPALSDDSGLSVDALGGAPGVLSARWAGETRDFDAAMRRVHEALLASGT
mgnify:CR=1 FL=1